MKRFQKFNRPHRCSICKQTGHRRETCPKREPEKKRRGNPLDKRTVYTTSRVVKPTQLKNLVQISYPEVCRVTEAQAERAIANLGLKLPPVRVQRRFCYKCKSKMILCKRLGKHALICSKYTCRSKMSRADLAHTLTWALQKGGDLKYTKIYQAMYVFGCKVAQDAGKHFLGLHYNNASKLFRKLRIACAFAELQTGRDMTFPDGTLEYDGTKTVISRKRPRTNKHMGRFLVCYHRETGNYCMEPLEDKDVLKGGPPPPEAYDEVKPLIVRTARNGHVVASDSAQGFKKVYKKDLAKKGIVYATVVHKKKQFVKVVRIPLTCLSARVRARVAKLPTTTSRTYRMKAGDQGAESTFDCVKRNLRRLNLQKSTSRVAANFLAAAWLHKNCGLEGVAKAVKMYTEARMNSVSCESAFDELGWLRPLESME